jgi:O-antigen/teichoic acid export membrane protein
MDETSPFSTVAADASHRGLAGHRLDYLTTFLAEGFVLVSALIVYRLVAHGLGTPGFSEYSLARRTLSFVLPLGVVGLDVGVARYVAYADLRNAAIARSYATAALLISSAAVSLFAVLVELFPTPLALLLFGSPELTPVLRALPLLVAGATLHVIAYANLRGRQQIQRANVVMIANHALLPLIAFGLAGASVGQFLEVLGGTWLGLSASVIVLSGLGSRRLGLCTKELFRFGLRRVPGDFVQLLFFTVPVLAASHFEGVVVAAYVAFAMTALGMTSSALTPISFVLLPMAARLLGTQSHAELRTHVVSVLRISLPILIAGVVIVEVFAAPLITLYLGSEFDAAAGPLRISMLAAIPWGTYTVLKSLIDAQHEEAVNARNIGVAFVVFVAIALALTTASPDAEHILVAFVVGALALVALTVLETHRILRGVSGGSAR